MNLFDADQSGSVLNSGSVSPLPTVSAGYAAPTVSPSIYVRFCFACYAFTPQIYPLTSLTLAASTDIDRRVSFDQSNIK
jgi:hypothetical protein